MRHDTGPGRDEKAQARDAAESAKATASQVGDEIKQEAQEQAENIRSQAASIAEEHRSEAGDTVAAVAAALHAGVSSLESDGQTTMAGYWRSAADSIDQLAERVKDKPAGEVLSEAEQYVREQPGLGFGGAMVAGFMLSRFLKSSSRGTPAAASAYSGTRTGGTGFGAGVGTGAGPGAGTATGPGAGASTANPIL